LTPSLFLRSEFRVRLLPSLYAPGQASASHQGNNDGQDRGFCPVDGAMAGVCEENLNDEDQDDTADPDERGNLPRVLSCPVLHALRMAWRKYRYDLLLAESARSVRTVHGLGGRTRRLSRMRFASNAT
jgi:hypothetical protein